MIIKPVFPGGSFNEKGISRENEGEERGIQLRSLRSRDPFLSFFIRFLDSNRIAYHGEKVM